MQGSCKRIQNILHPPQQKHQILITEVRLYKRDIQSVHPDPHLAQHRRRIIVIVIIVIIKINVDYN